MTTTPATATIPDITLTYCTCDKAEDQCSNLHEGDFEPDAFELWCPEDRKGTKYAVATTESLIIELLGQGITNFTPWLAGEQMVKILSTGAIFDTVDILTDNPELVRKYGTR